MPPSDAIAAAGTDVASEKQMQGSGESAEEGGEATSSSSMKSPVTPAAVCESNGTPALRWKSYTKQKESASHGKLASAPGVNAVLQDSKGKLVINLCGIPRTLVRVSSASTEVKDSKDQNIDNRKSDASTNSQEHASHHDGSLAGPIEAVGGPQTLPAASSDESVPHHKHVLELHSRKCHSKASDLAKKVFRRIRMVRRTLKVPKKVKTRRFRLEDSAEEPAMEATRQKGLTEADGIGETSNDLDTDECFRGNRVCEEQHNNGIVEDHQEVTGSEDLIYSDDENLSQKNNKEADIDHDAGRLRTTSGPTKDKQLKGISSADARQIPADTTLADAPCIQTHISVKDIDSTSRDIGLKDQVSGKGRARSLSNDARAFSETSKLDVKEQTVLETLLRDEAPGYSSGGGSEPSRGHRLERSVGADYSQKSGREELSQSGDSDSSTPDSGEDDDECSVSGEYDEEESISSESHECEDDNCNCNSVSPVSRGALGRGAVVTEQVSSVLCDAEGNVWHIGKRAEQARGKVSLKTFQSTARDVQSKNPSVIRKSGSVTVHEFDSNEVSGLSVAPYSEQIDLNWKWPSDVDYSISSVDVSNRSMVLKEKAVFVGCIPDGTENLEEILQSLMEKFLERFDFAPLILSEIRLVKIVKDFAFLELATEKVAQIVLAANQLDVFEWGVNGFHFNIEGCKGTHTSVRPLIEYMPMKPARVVFVGNVPKSRWQKEYLGVFFARILRAADGPADCKFVNSVYLLPESCDAYLELASEIMADAIVFKCIKNPQILKEIGEDVFICRDPSSVPLMSKHKGIVCPQRSLFIGVSAPGQEFKIDAVRKIFEDLLPIISRETNQPGYLEFISVQPGKDYAFFQLNSESIVDSVMEEYIKNTHLFACSSSPLSYIILRPPGYERPGARYRLENNRKGGLKSVACRARKPLPKFENRAGLIQTKRPKSELLNQLGIAPVAARRFGDEPAKKTDCVMSIGVSPLPRSTWNGLSLTGACAADSECMLVIEGLPKGFSYKLLRGALNELFEKSLCRTGLLELGMLVLRHLDKDSSLGVVASLPNAKFVNALLLLRKPLVVAGSELRLLPAVRRTKVTWKGSLAEHGRGQGELSCLSDDDVYEGEQSKCRVEDATRRKRTRSQVNRPQGRHGFAVRKNECKVRPEEWCEENLQNSSPPSKKLRRSHANGILRAVNGIHKAPSRGLKGKFSSKSTILTQWKRNILKGKVPTVPNVRGPLKFGNRDVEHLNESRSDPDDFPEGILHIVSEGGKRKIQTVEVAPKVAREIGKANIMNVSSKKRKGSHYRQDAQALKAAFVPKNFKKLRQVSRVL